MISQLPNTLLSQSPGRGQDTAQTSSKAERSSKDGEVREPSTQQENVARPATLIDITASDSDRPVVASSDVGFPMTEEWSRANEAANEAYAAMHLEEAFSFIRERLAEVELLEPKPAREVGTDEAEAVRKALAQDGTRVTFPEDGIFMAIHDSLMYTFTKDGKVTAHEPGVPKSQAEKDSSLSDLRNSIAELEKRTGGLSFEELRGNYEAASQEMTRVVEEARQQQQVETGQIEDRIA